MTRIDIFSGFLGAGKTTLIKKLIKEAYAGQKVVLIENEFGEIGIDGGFLKDAGIEIKEINSGCICCSLTGDFREALKKVEETYHPDRILIEPSGVGKLSEVAAAVVSAGEGKFELGGLTTVVDAKKAKMYIKNFGEFFNDQVSTAKCIILSRTQLVDPKLLDDVVGLMKALNENAAIITTPWDDIDGATMLKVMDGEYSLSEYLQHLIKEELEEDDDDDDEEECSCGCGHHHHHHHGDDDHDADEVFASWGANTAQSYTQQDIKEKLEHFEYPQYFGQILRAKGIVPAEDGGWIHFDYTPGEIDVRMGAAAPTGMICVIGAHLQVPMLDELFKVKGKLSEEEHHHHHHYDDDDDDCCCGEHDEHEHHHHDHEGHEHHHEE